MTNAVIYPRKCRTALSLALLLVSLLTMSPAIAEQNSDQKAAEKPPIKQDQTAKPDSEKKAEEDAEGTDKSADKSEAGSIKRFDPSEEISKDLSVSFPVDI